MLYFRTIQSGMASVEEFKRHSPVGKEFEPGEKDLEKLIKYHVDAFRPFLTKNVCYKDLLMHYPFFSPGK